MPDRFQLAATKRDAELSPGEVPKKPGLVVHGQERILQFAHMRLELSDEIGLLPDGFQQGFGMRIQVFQV
jgi:hypothetical protein